MVDDKNALFIRCTEAGSVEHLQPWCAQLKPSLNLSFPRGANLRSTIKRGLQHTDRYRLDVRRGAPVRAQACLGPRLDTDKGFICRQHGTAT